MGKYLLIVFYTALSVVLIGLVAYMTYDSLDKAWSMIECGRATEIYAETYCAKAWLGAGKANSLVTLLSSGLIYRAK